MALEKLQSQLSPHQQKMPPVEMWDPPFCGDIDIIIKANGDWFYNGTRITRKPLVKLFASVLKKENNSYFLVTPVEKVGIKVEDQPFLVTQWEIQTSDENEQIIKVETNLGDVVELGAEHPLALVDDALLITVRRNLKARVNRNVYYQWVEMAEEMSRDDKTDLVIKSNGQAFRLGSI